MHDRLAGGDECRADVELVVHILEFIVEPLLEGSEFRLDDLIQAYVLLRSEGVSVAAPRRLGTGSWRWNT